MEPNTNIVLSNQTYGNTHIKYGKKWDNGINAVVKRSYNLWPLSRLKTWYAYRQPDHSCDFVYICN